MKQQTFLIELAGLSEANAGRYADELRGELLDAASDVMVELQRSDKRAQDFGSTLVLTLGAPAVVVVAKALGDYLRRRRGVQLTVKTPNGIVKASNLTSKDAKSIVQILQGHD